MRPHVFEEYKKGAKIVFVVFMVSSARMGREELKEISTARDDIHAKSWVDNGRGD